MNLVNSVVGSRRFWRTLWGISFLTSLGFNACAVWKFLTISGIAAADIIAGAVAAIAHLFAIVLPMLEAKDNRDNILAYLLSWIMLLLCMGLRDAPQVKAWVFNLCFYGFLMGIGAWYWIMYSSMFLKKPNRSNRII